MRDRYAIGLLVVGTLAGFATYWVSLQNGMTLVQPPDLPWWMYWTPMVASIVMLVAGLRGLNYD